MTMNTHARAPVPHNSMWPPVVSASIPITYVDNQHPSHDQDTRKISPYPIYDPQFNTTVSDYRYYYPGAPCHQYNTSHQDQSKGYNEFAYFPITYRSEGREFGITNMPPPGDLVATSSPTDSQNTSTGHTHSSRAVEVRLHRPHTFYEHVGKRDVVIVQPSFDDHDARKSPTSPSPVKGINNEWQSRSPQQENKDMIGEEVASSTEPVGENEGQPGSLSVQFHDSTNYVETAEDGKDSFLVAADDHPDTKTITGRKHRRLFSDDSFISHSRMDSFGSAVVFGLPFNKHQRVDSAGLDILSAAVDATKEELAAAAGQGDTLRVVNPPLTCESMYQIPQTQLPPPPSYRYSNGHPISNRQQGYGGHENPHMHPPSRRGTGQGGPPSLPYLGLPGPSPYSRYVHHQYPQRSHQHPSTYPPHMYHHYPTQPPNPPPQHHAYHRSPFGPHMPPSSVQQSLSIPKTKGSESEIFRVTSPLSEKANALSESENDSKLWKLDRPSEGTSRQVAAATRPVSSTTQGSQTFVTAIAVGDGKTSIATTNHMKNASTNTDKRTGESSDQAVPLEVGGRHRRGMSSFSSIGFGTMLGIGIGAPDTPPTHSQSHPLKSNPTTTAEEQRHHRSTSSVSFFNSFLGNDNDTFLRNLQESTPGYRSPVLVASATDDPLSPSPTVKTSEPAEIDDTTESEQMDGKLAQGGTSKRVRRKCTILGCVNRVVQGGLCIQHGARRKLCSHEGCSKSVKKAGLCSTHGPARKRCSFQSCMKVAVQGGQCIQHGAKKKLCFKDGCQKQAILKGMCKKHHDLVRGTDSTGNDTDSEMTEVMGATFCREVTPTDSRSTLSATSNKTGSKSLKKPAHTRGLSIFHEMPADTVSSILNQSV